MKQAPTIPKNNLRLSWNELQSLVRSEWKQGQHFTIIAPTGGGKSVLAVRGLLPMWRYTLTLDAKGEDQTLRGSGKTIKEHPGWLSRQRDTRFHLLLPPNMETAAAISKRTLAKVFHDKGWTVYIDELRLFTDRNYLAKFETTLPAEVERLWLYGRSRGITVVAGTQAPRWISRAALEQASHFLIGRTTAKDALERFSLISVGNPDEVKAIVPTLDDFEFLYVGPRGMGIGKYPLRKEG